MSRRPAYGRPACCESLLLCRFNILNHVPSLGPAAPVGLPVFLGAVGAALADAEFLGPLASFLLLTLVVLLALISGLLVLTAGLLWPSLWPPLFHPKFW